MIDPQRHYPGSHRRLGTECLCPAGRMYLIGTPKSPKFIYVNFIESWKNKTFDFISIYIQGPEF